ncbi:MAG: hypothetical protein HYV09_24320 [Deltaproteobacteria bacterium]|nr:hypothetical protein [Deltaproteobacteria bacterium]
MELRALIVAYAFPPVGGAGVQRMAKLVKYLPDHGVRPAVLTVANPSVPLRDPSLLRDVSPELEIVRARTFEPGYATKSAAWSATTRRSLRARALRAATSAARSLLVPDAQILWAPAAARALAARLLARRDDAVLISGPPFSQYLLAPLARTCAGVVLDYRDEWSTYRTSYEMTAGRASRLAGDVLEPALLRAAHLVTTATDDFRRELLERFSFLDPARVITVPNGWDRDDFPVPRPAPPTDRFVVTYAGTIFRLTSARGLLAGVRLLNERDPALARLLSMRFLGRIVETERDAFAGFEGVGVEIGGYVPHDRVLAELSASHLALCLLDAVPGAERIYPAKIFELMHLGRPILTLAPEGALARLVRAHALGEVLPPRDAPAIAEALSRRLRAFRDQGPKERAAPVLRAKDVERYDRRALAGEFAAVLREAVASAPRRRQPRRVPRRGVV